MTKSVNSYGRTFDPAHPAKGLSLLQKKMLLLLYDLSNGDDWETEQEESRRYSFVGALITGKGKRRAARQVKQVHRVTMDTEYGLAVEWRAMQEALAFSPYERALGLVGAGDFPRRTWALAKTSPQSLSRALGSLERRGLLRRLQIGQQRETAFVVLTPFGMVAGLQLDQDLRREKEADQ